MQAMVYRRTHRGDPDKRGCFGINDCMGMYRGWEFDAVIGVGGISAPRHLGIARKVNWIGIGPTRWTQINGQRGPRVTFDNFLLRDASGPDFEELAPILANRIYKDRGRRPFFEFSPDEEAEIARILKLAEDAPPSIWAPQSARVQCNPRQARNRKPQKISVCRSIANGRTQRGSFANCG
jgi:hypothetical protein